MRILYAVQGTGNGHLSRARDIIPALEKHGEVDVLVSGIQGDVSLDKQPEFQCHGISFIFGKRGGIDLLRTCKQLKPVRFMIDLFKLPIHSYDLVISDFEPVSAWAGLLRGKKVIGLSHQAAVQHLNSPKPDRKDLVGSLILRYYAPCTVNYGFHFKAYGKEMFAPVIRKEIRAVRPSKLDHYCVYLPAVGDRKLIKVLSKLPVKWQVFSKHSQQHYVVNNVHINPINNERFIQKLSSCKGIICGAGFEGPAEALFLNKKVLVIPMKGQYEQHCNAAALKQLGVPVIDKLNIKNLNKLQQFIDNEQKLAIAFPDQTAHIIQQIISEHVTSFQPETWAFSGS